MFTYCLNNPIGYSDATGDYPRFFPVCFDDGEREFISDQNAPQYSDMKYGIASIGHGGCGPIAVYNALVMLGRNDSTFSDIVAYFERNNYTIFGGILGSEIGGCVQYFKDQGYIVMIVPNTAASDDIANVADACILWYNYVSTSGLPIGTHFVALKQIHNTGYYYNAYKGLETAYIFSGGPNQFMKEYAEGGFGGLLICIFEP